MLTFLVYCAGLVWLMNTYRRLTGIWVNGWSQRGEGRVVPAGSGDAIPDRVLGASESGQLRPGFSGGEIG